LAECNSQGFAQIYFVTHSLGGILVREYLAHRPVPGLQKVVMLGPPNRGSGRADYAESLFLLQTLLPQAVAQLGTSAESVPLRLGRVNFQLGVIAGTRNHLPFLPGQPPGPSDGTVAVDETIVSGMTDFLVLPVSHSFMMWDEQVQEQTLYFLRHGVFRRFSPPFSAP
jgi:pimeloyl-ACP methyl ester carboxylesterase